MIVLKHDGFYAIDWDGKRRRHVLTPINLYSLDLLNRWEDEFTIKGTVTLRDLLRLVSEEFSPELREVVGRIARANFPAYLTDEELLRSKRRKSDLMAIEVHLRCDLEFGGRYKKGQFNPSSSAHGLAKPNKEGHTSYAIEFTPWVELLDLPLKVHPCAFFTTRRFRRKTKDELAYDKDQARKARKNSSLWVSKDPYTSDASEYEEVKTAMSLGEFFVGLFDEACFFSSPKERDAERANLAKISQRMRREGKKK